MIFCTHPTELSSQCGQTVYPSPELRRVQALIGSPVQVCFYHQRLIMERLDRADSYLSEEELRATMGELSAAGGRTHGDGRRLDQYIDPRRARQTSETLDRRARKTSARSTHDAFPKIYEQQGY